MEVRETAGILDAPVVPTWPPDLTVFYVEVVIAGGGTRRVKVLQPYVHEERDIV